MTLASYTFAGSTIGASPIPVSVTADNIIFDGFSLQNDNIIISEANFEDSGASEFNWYPIPRLDGNGFLSRFWRKKTIVLKGIVKDTTKALLDARIDEIKRECYGTEWTFEYVDANGRRKITATLSRADFDRQHFHITFCPFVLTFETNEAFWYDEINESNSVSAVTGNFIDSLSVGGSAPSQPQVYFVLNSATAITAISFTANGRTITVTESFASGDVLEINSQSKTVTKNAVEVDYTGTFPELLPWPNAVNYNFTGTAINTEIITLWRKNYL